MKFLWQVGRVRLLVRSSDRKRRRDRRDEAGQHADCNQHQEMKSQADDPSGEVAVEWRLLVPGLHLPPLTKSLHHLKFSCSAGNARLKSARHAIVCPVNHFFYSRVSRRITQPSFVMSIGVAVSISMHDPEGTCRRCASKTQTEGPTSLNHPKRRKYSLKKASWHFYVLVLSVSGCSQRDTVFRDN